MMRPAQSFVRIPLVFAFALGAFAPATAQFNVDSVKQLLARTPEPIAHLKLLRQLSKANDSTTMRTYAYETIRYADSLLAHGFAGDFTVLTQKGGGMWNVGTQYYRRGLPDSANVWFTKAAGHWKAIGDKERTAFAYSYLASPMILRGEAIKALALLKEARAAHEALHDTVGLCTDHGAMGSAYYNLGDFPRAIDHYFTALGMLRPGTPDGGAAYLTSIGHIYQGQMQVDTALTYYYRAVVAGTASLTPPSACTALNNIATTHVLRKNYPEALAACRQGLELLAPDRFPNETAMLLTTMGTTYREMGDLDQAVKYGRSAVAAAQKGTKVGSLIAALAQLGWSWVYKGRDDKALEVATEANVLCDKGTMPLIRRMDVAMLLSDIYTRTGPADKALLYYQEYVALKDSIRNEDIRKKLALLDLRKQETADSLRAAKAMQVQKGEHQLEMGAETGRKRLFMYGGLGVLVLAGGLWWRLRHTRRAKRSVEKERDRSDTLLHNILPSEVAQELKDKGEAQARDIENVSILFTDFKGFTEMSEQLTAQELVAEINTCFKAFDGIIGKHGVEKIKTIGDAYMAAGGLLVATDRSAIDTVLAALEMQDFMKSYTAQRIAAGKPAFTMRVGIHTGPVVAGIVGVKKFAYDIWGDTVNTASRMESSGEVGQVNISESTYALVKDTPGLSFTPRGKVQAKGKGEMEMYFVSKA